MRTRSFKAGLLLVTITTLVLVSCATTEDPDPSVLIHRTPTPAPEPTGSTILDQAIDRRSSGHGEPDQDMVTLGVLAGAAINTQNGFVPDELEIEDGEKAAGILSDFWNVESREDLLLYLDSRIEGGFRGLYERVVNQIAVGEVSPDDVETSDFLIRNAAFLGIRAVNAFELGRLSSIVRWGYAAGYLEEAETRYLMEDIGLAISDLGYDPGIMADGQMTGIALIYRSSDRRSTELRDRALLCYELIEDGAWAAEEWNRLTAHGRALLADGSATTPGFSDQLRSVLAAHSSATEDEQLLPLFDPEARPQSILGEFRHEYELLQAVGSGDLAETRRVVEQAVDAGLTFIDAPPGKAGSWTGRATSHPSILAFLLDSGFSPDVPHGLHKTPAIHWAIVNREPESLDLLLAHGVNIEARDQEGDTPLMESLLRDAPDLAQRLIDAGADVNARRNNGYHPLLAASGNGRIDLVRSLLRYGARRDVTSSQGYNALFIYANAVHFTQLETFSADGGDRWREVVDFAPLLDEFIAMFPDLRHRLPNDQRPLVWFLRMYGSPKQIASELEYLEFEHPSYQMDDSAGYTISHALIRRGQVENLQRALAFAGDTNYQLDNGYHILYFACTNPDHYWAIPPLIQAGADPNLRGYRDYHCLTAILEDGEFRFAVDFVEQGADINVPNALTRRPMSTELFDQVLRADLGTDTRRELLVRLIDAGALLMAYDRFDPEFWSMPYHVLTRTDTLDLQRDLARYARASGQDLGPELNARIEDGESSFGIPGPWDVIEMTQRTTHGVSRYVSPDGTIAFRAEAAIERIGPDEDLPYRLVFEELDFARSRLYLAGGLWQGQITRLEPARVIELTEDAARLTQGNERPTRGVYRHLIVEQNGERYLASLFVNVPYSEDFVGDSGRDSDRTRTTPPVGTTVQVDPSTVRLNVDAKVANWDRPGDEPRYRVTARFRDESGDPLTTLTDAEILVNGHPLWPSDNLRVFEADRLLALERGDLVTLTVSHPSIGTFTSVGRIPTSVPNARLEPGLPESGVPVQEPTYFRVEFDGSVPAGLNRFAEVRVYREADGQYEGALSSISRTMRSFSPEWDGKSYLLDEDGSPFPYLRFRSLHVQVVPIDGLHRNSSLRIEAAEEWSVTNTVEGDR